VAHVKIACCSEQQCAIQFVEEDANSGDNAAHRTCARNRFAKLSTQTRAGKKRLRNDERTSAVETGKHLANSGEGSAHDNLYGRDLELERDFYAPDIFRGCARETFDTAQDASECAA
jgi:hypothetical protein